VNDLIIYQNGELEKLSAVAKFATTLYKVKNSPTTLKFRIVQIIKSLTIKYFLTVKTNVAVIK
jgi:hypothetical protein